MSEQSKPDVAEQSASAARARVIRVAVGWVVVVLAAGVLLDARFGGTDRAIAAGGRPVPSVGFVESFDQAPSTAGANLPIRNLVVAEGEFAAADGQARRVGAGNATALASLPGDALGGVSLKITGAHPDSGLVFRYKDPANFWILTPNPQRGDWLLVKVAGGQDQQVGEAMRLADVDEVRFTVIFDGDQIIVKASDRLVAAASDPFLAGVASAGFTAQGERGADAGFDDLVLFYPGVLEES